MNERILELAEQTGYIWHASGNPQIYEFTPEKLEKFAELIVQECAEICLEMAAKCAGLPGDGALARDCAHWIKKDFGVEQ